MKARHLLIVLLFLVPCLVSADVTDSDWEETPIDRKNTAIEVVKAPGLPGKVSGTGEACTSKDYQRLYKEWSAKNDDWTDPPSPTGPGSCATENPGFSLFALLRGCGRFVFESPQCLAAFIEDQANPNIEETNTIQVCASPLCHHGEGNNPIPIFDHVWLRINTPGCLQQDIDFGSEDGSLCGPGRLQPGPSEQRPEQQCHSVNINRSQPGLGSMDDCDRSDMISCMAKKLDKLRPSYNLFGSNCGDISNFLLYCAGLKARVQFNLNLGCNRGDPEIQVPGDPETGPIFKRCCGPDLTPGTRLSLEATCEMLRQECYPCPSGQCFNSDSGACAGGGLYPGDGAEQCDCPHDGEFRDPQTGTCSCPDGASLLLPYPEDGQRCVCRNPRKELPPPGSQPPFECVCKGKSIESDGECKCPPGMIWDEERNHGECVCEGEYSGGVYDPEIRSCRCREPSFWNGTLRKCECPPPLVPSPTVLGLFCCDPINQRPEYWGCADIVPPTPIPRPSVGWAPTAGPTEIE